MGISATGLKFILYCTDRFSLDFTKTATLGRQAIDRNRATKRLVMKHLDGGKGHNVFADGYCEALLRCLGADAVDSFDASDYEGATFVHDLNMPIPAEYKGKYSLLIDGGTTEHVFNLPIAYKSIMDMVDIGGHIIHITPTNNMCGHSLYQISPEFFYSLYNRQNGFEVKAVAYGLHTYLTEERLWLVPNPIETKRRSQIYTSSDTLLYVCVKKIAESPEILTVQQSDYVNQKWDLGNTGNNISYNKYNNTITAWLWFKLPPRIKRAIICTINKEKPKELRLQHTKGQ
jgi:hypothetical protein